jgi:transcriptional regulator with XRE-family HTH domain
MKIDQLSPDKSILKELGERLARIRKQQGYSQDRLAEEAGLGVATLRRIEDGQDSQMGSWLKLLKALQMTAAIEQLLPENFKSPMAEVKDQQKRRKKTEPGINWGDES